ncbi:DUF5107 domain-containing protein [Clostridium sp. DL1XJH146]
MNIGWIEKRNKKMVCFNNGIIQVQIVPSLGGKISSIKFLENGFEFLEQNNLKNYEDTHLYDSFANFSVDGFDDCFPSIQESTEYYNGEKVTYPDHGEIWSSSMDTILKEDSIALSMKSSILTYTFSKKISIREQSVIIDYTIVNTGTEDLEAFYTVHCLTRCEEDMVLNFPKGTKEVLNVCESDVLGEFGSIHKFPETTDIKGKQYRLDRIKPKTAKKCEKYYVLGNLEEGRCGVYYPKSKMMYEMLFDVTKLPYCGFWLTEGGFKDSYNCAFEPSSGFYDSMEVAKENDKFNKIKPNETFEFSLEIVLSKRNVNYAL